VAGRYAVALTPGEYAIVGIDTGSGWIQTNKPFIVTDTNPKTVDVAANQMMNIKGIVQQRKNRLSKVWVAYGLKSEVTADSSKVKWVQTDELGVFTLHLPNGEYVITDINNPNIGTWKELNQSFTAGSQLNEVTISVPLQ
jgi:hypothetical protein